MPSRLALVDLALAYGRIASLDLPLTTFSARGNHGQFVFVSPPNQVVIARNGRDYGVPPRQWIALFEAMAGDLGRNAEP